MTLQLISHPLCPYVQRASIALSEKGIAFVRTDIDLADKPAWFTAISPLGKTPLLQVDGDAVVFESAVICEYLEETSGGPALHPRDPLERARHRGWIEVASATLNDIAGLYNAPDQAGFERKRDDLDGKLARIEAALGQGPFFSGENFSLVDAAFAPVFRYFEVIDSLWDADPFAGLPKTAAWRKALASRPSVVTAVAEDYAGRLTAFLQARKSYVSRQFGPHG